jgi:DNA-directed RNA polymerase specialized sigma24 family protein
MASWLRTIAAHAVTDYYRHRARPPRSPHQPRPTAAEWPAVLAEALEALPPYRCRP